MTERDVAVLRSLSDFGFLTAAQLERLHFHSAQTATRRLRRLAAAGLVRATSSRGLPDRIFFPTPAGRAAAGIDDGRRSAGRLPAALFLRHALDVAEFRIALHESVRERPGVELLNFVGDADRHLHRSGLVPQSPLRAGVWLGERQLLHAPDAAFALRRDSRMAAFYVEIDRGTEVIGSPERGVGKLIRFYRGALLQMAPIWLQSVLQLPATPDAVRVLIVTSSATRAQNIRRACGIAAGNDPTSTRIWVADAAILTGPDLLGPTWASLDPRDEKRYAVVEGDSAQ